MRVKLIETISEEMLSRIRSNEAEFQRHTCLISFVGIRDENNDCSIVKAELEELPEDNPAQLRLL